MQVRVTGVLIENSKVLILRQATDTGRKFSLPGGRVEDGEALGDALVREMHEETGLVVEPGRLLYICDQCATKRCCFRTEVRDPRRLAVAAAG